MSNALIQLLVLAGVALFLVLRLKNTLGTREGFEQKPPMNGQAGPARSRPNLEVVEAGDDPDISDNADPKSKSGLALAAMKTAEPEFNVTEFLSGARGAYEMLLMAFEDGNKDLLKQFLSDDVYTSFVSVIEAREAEGLRIDATFIGVRELKLTAAEFNRSTREGEVTIKFVAELTSVVRDQAGEIVDGNAEEIKRQKDVWSFSRVMGSDDPNWQLVSTGG
jgi:predicted lipid-binding transport protein (Tim44 family)